MRFEFGRALFEAAPEPKRFEALIGAGHNDTAERGGRSYLDHVRALPRRGGAAVSATQLRAARGASRRGRAAARGAARGPHQRPRPAAGGHAAGQQRVERLHGALALAGLRFRPSVWLSTAWFSPDGVPGFAVPFFLAHPRLAALERAHMFEVEGATREDCARLLRHEAGHALDTAYRLHRRADWREHFGRASEPYRRGYVPRPDSRHYVHHLQGYYAQSHPFEDFAETFAVWLGSRGRWRATTPAGRRCASSSTSTR